MKKWLLVLLFSFSLFAFAEEDTKDVYITEIDDGSKFIDIDGHKHNFTKFEKRADGEGYDRYVVNLKWLYEKCKELEKKLENN